MDLNNIWLDLDEIDDFDEITDEMSEINGFGSPGDEDLGEVVDEADDPIGRLFCRFAALMALLDFVHHVLLPGDLLRPFASWKIV